MKAEDLPCKQKPCLDCPFLKDTMKGWLGSTRMEGIIKSDSFTCHKHRYNRLQCAGHMLLLGKHNQFVRLSENLGIKLQQEGRELVFDTAQECIDHHEFFSRGLLEEPEAP